MIDSLSLRLLAIFSLLLGMVAGCTTSLDNLGGRSGQLGLAEIWSMTGKLGVQSPAENTSLGIWWSQNEEEFEITFRGALAFGAGRLSSHSNNPNPTDTGSDASVKLERNGKKAIYGSSPEQLVAQLLGQEIPVSPMKYWVRGMPSPEASYTEGEGSIKQLGWQVEYTRDNKGLPRRIILNRDDVRLKLVVKSWSY